MYDENDRIVAPALLYVDEDLHLQHLLPMVLGTVGPVQVAFILVMEFYFKIFFFLIKNVPKKFGGVWGGGVRYWSRQSLLRPFRARADSPLRHRRVLPGGNGSKRLGGRAVRRRRTDPHTGLFLGSSVTAATIPPVPVTATYPFLLQACRTGTRTG